MKDTSYILSKFVRSDGKLNSAAIKNITEDDVSVINSLTLNIDGDLRMKLLCIVNNISSTPVCECCGSKITKIEKQKPVRFCSTSCAAKNMSAARVANTNHIKAAEKRKRTMLSKYGVEYNLQREDVKEKLRQPKIEHTAYELLNDVEWLTDQHINKKRTSVEIADDLGVYYGTVISYIRKHNIPYEYHTTSSKEEGIVEYILESMGVNFVRNVRSIIPPLELDFYIPEHNLAIEVNGLYWHSELAGKDKWYHVNKTNKCEEIGISLLQFWDTEITQKTNILESVLRSKLNKTQRVYARKCLCYEVDSKTARSFFEETHLQGFVSAERYIGLYNEDELVACMSLSTPRFSSVADKEIIRFSSKLNHTVVGGMSKLLKFANVTSVISYANRRWSSAKSYSKIGFTITSVSAPGYYYFDNEYKLLSRNKFQKHKLYNVLDDFNPSLSEWQNMKNNGYNRVWDCGNVVTVWRL